MKVDFPALESLEYQQLLALLADLCQTSAARERALGLHPSVDENHINDSLDEISEYLLFRSQKGSISFVDVKDLREILRTTDLSTAILEPQELLSIRQVIMLAHEVIDLFKDQGEECPHLFERVQEMQKIPKLLESINRTVGSDGEILDNASSKLRKIRQKIYRLREKIYSSLERLMGKADVALHIQDNIVTQRNQRFVIPLKTEAKSKIKGIIHDQSATGATLFIEPLSVLPQNNELLQERLAEQKEIKSILRNITNLCRDNLAVIETDMRVISHLDFLQAKTFLAMKLKASRPRIKPHGSLNIQSARHPLLIHYLSYDEVVPIEIRVSDKNGVLLISGPNMGGKTVALKTAGLMVLMVQAGLFVPALPDSQFPIFQSLFTDIGDMQDLSQSLSTFASHLMRIKKILDEAGSDSFVLLDELGTGTDPDEGAALGQMILDELFARQAFTIATTHLTYLKQVTMKNSEDMVASVQFDPSTGKPTYQLIYRQYGDSNAFFIAQNMGIDPFYIDKARRYLNPQQRQIKDLMTTLDDKKDELVQKELKLSASFHALEQSRLQAEETAKQQLLIAQREGQRLLTQVRERIRFVHQELNALQQKAKTAPDIPKEKIKTVTKTIAKELADIEKKVAPPPPPKKPEPTRKPDPAPPETWQIGDVVALDNTGKSGKISQIWPEKKVAMISMSGMKLKVPFQSLTRKVQVKSTIENDPVISFERSDEGKSVPYKLSLLGERVDDALSILDKYLDDAVIFGHTRVLIVHGIGQEKLGPAVRDFLKSHPHVSTWRSGEQSEGGYGATVVELIQR